MMAAATDREHQGGIMVVDDQPAKLIITAEECLVRTADCQGATIHGLHCEQSRDIKR